jgi:hypothetical protein
VLSADNQQERLETGNFLAGFVEGEGSFNISLRKKIDYKVSWQIVLSFNVSQRDPTLLYLLKQTLECGIIKKRKDGVFSLDVTTPSDVVYKVIPFFKKFPLRSSDKCRNFDLFVKAATLMKNGEHKNRIGLRKILEIREQINLGKGRTRKYSIFNVFPA